MVPIARVAGKPKAKIRGYSRNRLAPIQKSHPGFNPWAIAAQANRPPAQPAQQTNAPVPAAPAALPAPVRATATQPRLDSTYLGWQAQREGEVQQQRIQLDTAEQTDAATRQESLRRLALQRPQDLQQADVSANKAGLFYSGQLGKVRGEIQADYTRREADTNATFNQQRAARDAARMALENGYTVEQAAQLAAAADRGIAVDAEAADAGSLAPPTVTSPRLAQPHPGLKTNRVDAGKKTPLRPTLPTSRGGTRALALKNRAKKKRK